MIGKKNDKDYNARVHRDMQTCKNACRHMLIWSKSCRNLCFNSYNTSRDAPYSGDDMSGVAQN